MPRFFTALVMVGAPLLLTFAALALIVWLDREAGR